VGKQYKGFRLTDSAVFILEQLADKLGLSMTGVIETALRQMGKREGITQCQENTTLQEKDSGG